MPVSRFARSTALRECAVVQKNGIADLVGRKNLSKLVQVSVSENIVTVDAKIAVYYGACISDVCADIRKNVSKKFEIMTGLSVKAVNILVEGLSFKDEKQEA